jgi:RsiW-degrading membrane proteinase PrsW (M82 family)
MTGDDGVPLPRPGMPFPQVPPQLLGRPRRRSSLAFTVVLAVVMFLGACVVAFVLAQAGAPDALVVGVLLAALPVGPVVATYLWLDRYEPEPVGLLVLAFGWGALVATAIAALIEAADRIALNTSLTWSAIVVAPVTEEAGKGLFIFLLLWFRRREIDGVLDGIVYAGLVGVGFAFTENVLYLAGAYMGGHHLGPGGLGAATGLFVVRGIFSPFAHPLFTSATGIGVGYAVITRNRFWRVASPILGYLVAVCAHGLWNASVFVGGGQTFLVAYVLVMVPAFLLFVGFAVWARRREGRMLTRALTDCANRGFLGHPEVPWLVRLPGRRVARSFARSNGGRVAAKVMGEYQQQAIELGFLHDRYLRGTAPDDFVERGSAMVNRLAALRPYALFPRPAGARWEGAR